MKPEPVNLICAANAGYFMPLSVMLVSVVDHFERGRDLIIHIFSNDATEERRRTVLDSLRLVRSGLDCIQVEWHTIDEQTLAKLPPMDGYPPDIFSRIIAPLVLPDSCERAIYLDSDVVVLADLAKLYDRTANAKTVLHAVQDTGCPWVSSRDGIFDYRERDIPARTPYFNSGVLVMNLKLWRERHLTSLMIDYARENREKIFFPDQTALNAFLYNDWTPLDFRWNQLPSILQAKHLTSLGYSREYWARERRDPCIVHYLGHVKPWLPGLRHLPRRIFFFKYLGKTVYRGTVPRYPYLEALLGFPLYYHLWNFGQWLFPQGFKGGLFAGKKRPVSMEAVPVLL